MIPFNKLTENHWNLSYAKRMVLLAIWIREERDERGMVDQDGDDLCRGCESVAGHEDLAKAGFDKKIEDAIDYCDYYNISYRI